MKIADRIPVNRVSQNEIRELMNDGNHAVVSVLPYTYNSSSGRLVEDTFIPSSYENYRRRQNSTGRNIKGNRREPYRRLGPQNKYAFFLLDLLRKSPLHKRAALNSASLAFGKGLRSAGDPISDEFLAWLISKGFNDKVVKKILQQIAGFGGCYLTMRFGNFQNNGRKYGLIDFDAEKYYKWRIGKEASEGEYRGLSDYNWWHPNYNKANASLKDVMGVPTYQDFEDTKTTNRHICTLDKDKLYFSEPGEKDLNLGVFSFLIGEDSMDSEHYPSPAYISDATIDAILLDAALSNFDISGLLNGLTAGYIVTVPISGIERKKREDPDGYNKIIEETKARVEDELEGTENNNRTVVVVQDVSSAGVKPVPISIAEIPHTNSSDIHTVMDERKTRNILSGWGIVDSRLIGVPHTVGAGLSNQADTLRIAEDIWYNTCIYGDIVTPFHCFLMDTMAPMWFAETGRRPQGGVPDVYLERKRMFFKDIPDKILESAFTVDEIREMAGYPPMSSGDRTTAGLPEGVPNFKAALRLIKLKAVKAGMSVAEIKEISRDKSKYALVLTALGADMNYDDISTLIE